MTTYLLNKKPLVNYKRVTNCHHFPHSHLSEHQKSSILSNDYTDKSNELTNNRYIGVRLFGFCDAEWNVIQKQIRNFKRRTGTLLVIIMLSKY